MESLLSLRDVQLASQLLDTSSDCATSLELANLRGRLIELSAHRGHPHLSLAVELLASTHRTGEPAAWIGPSTSIFYPPDAAGWTLDWSALAIIQLSDTHRRLRAADKLLRSGAFGLVVIDLPDASTTPLPQPLIGRLARLAETHDSAAVFLTNTAEGASSLSSLISLRARALWKSAAPHRLQATFSVVKDKRRGPGHRRKETYHGPLGLR